MTLREKFEDGYNDYKENAKYCETIADEFAINFANWYHFMIEQVDNLNSKFTPKELIEMFKKEKGL
jgi:hypothetical protein